MASSGMATKVYPAFRPDQALNVHLPERLNAWLGKLEAVANISIATLNDLVDALRQRHDFFHKMGGRLSDHGLNLSFRRFRQRGRSGGDLRAGAHREGRHASGTCALRQLS